MIKEIIAILIALTGYPIGLLIAHYTKEELKGGRIWFKAIIVVCVLAIITSIITLKGETLLFLISAAIFILIVALASLVKSMKRRRK